MTRFGKVAVAGALAAMTLGGMAAPAEAHIGTGGAIIAGLAGLGIGAAIASDHPHHRYYAYDAAPPPPPPAYGYGAPVAYEPGPGYGYGYEAPRCRMVPQWDGWAGRYVPVRHCW